MAAITPPTVINHVESNGNQHRYRIIGAIGFTSHVLPIAATATATATTSTSPTNFAGSSTSTTSATNIASTSTIMMPVYVAYASFPHSTMFVSIACIHTVHIGQLDTRRNMDQLIGALYPPFTYKGFYCIVFPYMGLGSVKSVMEKYFPVGIPERGVLVVMREALTRLREIHQRGFRHREICSAHIYASETPEIKMGYLTSAFDLKMDFKGSDRSAATHTWAAAPEVFGAAGGEYTEKCDVWSIGFTALELVYGGFEFINRDYLEYVLERMRTKRKIFGKSIVMKNVTVASVSKKDWKTRVGQVLGKFNPNKKNKVSREFVEMVLKCLAVNPDQRPMVVELLQMRIFRELQRDASYFQGLVNGEVNLR